MIGFKISKWKRARSELESEQGQSRAHEHVRVFARVPELGTGLWKVQARSMPVI